MRPTRLELSGFASFREQTTVDFADADLFVLTGPTGSGKSSLVDAMVFALYGCVPRYDDKRLVAPVITQGQLEARVRLDFTVEGRAYTAVRVVRRTKTGATTKEARLERDGRTLAGTADELTAAVESLLGLTFEHFTRTVVLPQGDFQEFLHAKPKDRQDLLVRLLDLEVYRRVAQAARSDEAQAKGAIEGLRSRLEGELAGATEQAVTAASKGAAALERLVADLDQARPELEELVERGRSARQAARQATERRDALDAIAAPEGLDALAEELAAATAAVAAAESAQRQAADALDAARARRGELPPTIQVEQVLEATRAHAAAAAARDELRPQAQAVATRAERAEDARAEAASEVERAQAQLDEARRRHAAHALARGLQPGDPCPVCKRALDDAPNDEPPADLAAAEAALADRRARRNDAEGVARAAEAEASTLTARLEAAERGLAERAEQLEQRRRDVDLPTSTRDLPTSTRDLPTSTRDLPTSTGELEALVGQLREADQAVTRAEAATGTARTRLGRARAAQTALDDRRAAAWEAFDRSRDTVAALEPPRPDRDDLGAAWGRLLAWVAATRPTVTARAAEAEQAIQAATDEYRKRVGELRDRALEAGVEVGTSPEGADPFSHLRDTCVGASTRAAAQAEQLAEHQRQAAEVRTRLEQARKRVTLDHALGQHLNARRFEKWLLNRALQRLVVGASEVLRELSDGGYSLALADDNTFLVTDHRNADEQRSARTLSGGETFLASLSLALSLAADVAALAAQGSARLEALFLDEGFGTLDADTLDTVASAIEELGSRGRMVGLITHVRELSERVPVRFEVTKGPSGSSVQRVVT